ncbi:hypothetical protein K435DRAFT_973779 [Dendrothele bispora CBS 962.96]|uniref:Zn(2)-C6 fungal-type domain-containing protein n=1 Tax=Dendrothele bispora (strain CBS 962.96) TaxID=1314807 RepID=A0A4S8KRA0_DENBC|nr:hypothetical protein K435DRAFT_973779 [Dendrothele bispora CBS 962.96]
MKRATKTKTKTVPACTSCKKSKARCEILDDITQKSLQNVRCHRCKTLQIQCSYESMDKSIFSTGPVYKTHEFEQVVRLDMDLSNQPSSPVQDIRVVPENVTTSPASIGSASNAPTPATAPAPIVGELSTVVARSSTGQTVVDVGSLPSHIWEFYRGSAGDWHYGGIFHYEDSLDWAHPLGAIQQLSDRYNASVLTRPRILAAATSRSAKSTSDSHRIRVLSKMSGPAPYHKSAGFCSSRFANGFDRLSSNYCRATGSSLRDTRLDLFGQILDATEAGLKVPLNSLDDVPKWYNDIHEALQRLGHLERLITPLPVVADHDTFYFRMLIILYRACRLLVLYHATFSARMLFIFAGRTPSPRAFEGIIPHNLDVLAIWSKDAFHTTETNLISLLEVDVSLLGTSPDITFHIISLVVTYLVSFKFFVFNSRYKATPFTHDFVTAKCVGVLNTAAYSEDHPAVKCARLIEGVQSLWENREEMFKLGDAPVLRPEDRITPKKTGYYYEQSNMQEAVHETVGKNLEMLYKPAGPS